VELLGGHVDVVCCSAPEAASQLESGQARVLAVLGPERLEEFPQFPTAREQGVDYEAVGWRGIMLPPKTPSAVVQRLSGALEEIVQSEGFRDFMRKNGFVIALRGPAAFKTFLDQEEVKWRAVIENAGYATLGENHDPGPRAVPLALLTLLLGALGAELWAGYRSRVPGELPGGAATAGGGRGRAVWLMAGLGLYLAVMPWVGFAASTWPFAFALMWWLGTRWWLAGLVSGLLVGSVQLLFVMLFKVQLP
jgi:hypothetical protein